MSKRDELMNCYHLLNMVQSKINKMIEDYDGGDRPPSPPASLLTLQTDTSLLRVKFSEEIQKHNG